MSRAGSGIRPVRADIAAIIETELRGELARPNRRIDEPECWTILADRMAQRFNLQPPPAAMPSARWEQFVSDAIGACRDGWVDRATALGWSLFDLFGCHPTVPLSRFDLMGLVLLLDGNRIVAVSEHAAAIETKLGGRQSFRRSENMSDAVFVWDLDRADHAYI